MWPRHCSPSSTQVVGACLDPTDAGAHCRWPRPLCGALTCGDTCHLQASCWPVLSSGRLLTPPSLPLVTAYPSGKSSTRFLTSPVVCPLTLRLHIGHIPHRPEVRKGRVTLPCTQVPLFFRFSLAGKFMAIRRGRLALRSPGTTSTLLLQQVSAPEGRACLLGTRFLAPWAGWPV